MDITTSSTPWPLSHSSMYARNGRSTSGTTGLGTVDVSGRSRVPSPPTRITACIRAPSHRQGDLARATDPLVVQAGGADRLRVQGVAAVDDQPPGHRLAHRGPVEVPELLPLGDQHDRVGVADAVERVAGELHAVDQLAG